MNMANLMKQAQQMQTKMAALKKELHEREIDVSVGGGAVQLKMNGRQEIKELKISKEAVDPEDVETLEELLQMAFNQGSKETHEMVEKSLSKITGGMHIPGLF